MNTPWSSIADLGGKVIDKIWPSPEDKAKRDEAKAKLIAAEQAGELQEMEYIWRNADKQADINLQEAKSDSFWVAGGRPAIIWVFAAAMSWNYLFLPVTVTVAKFWFPDYVGSQADFTAMLPVLLGILGLGGLRTYEKKAGVTKRGTGG